MYNDEDEAFTDAVEPIDAIDWNDEDEATMDFEGFFEEELEEHQRNNEDYYQEQPNYEYDHDEFEAEVTELVDMGLDKQTIMEVMNNREAEREGLQQKEDVRQFEEFLSFFEKQNNRPYNQHKDVGALNQDVWMLHDQYGMSLKDAYEMVDLANDEMMQGFLEG